ncbi:conserved hypothetical protein [Vibrio nigripulchritudo MADA3029]|uniref:Tetratricopeptide repeat protein n=2 Tax=Vibrio nigripulchritudo TaxID=28173 RepID=U4KJ27_9VIBR|nr:MULTISPECIES: hypothetical protein [Vibrio]EGU56382.1 hypothetical protein VINI7043_20971 [Vibrio nigripulchritudo ATCC 27043]UAB73110.1 hypothetical protein INR79_18230 [Vibrio sp. SCSIO 43132]CCN48819.1 conserved hypothetical protein [Vibrio nigripulchritudo MADA3020]CCN54079.1 conserved hypothetical protein [Vibrio nigripulchritudo MADA3021]CCN60940.1 conserved hypothetical protein [Vibrio nigripulchritudo MADA3029]
MDLEQCWARFMKAEELLEQGHWPEARYLFEDVLDHLPSHISEAVESDDIKPCQMSCLLAGFKDAAISQSEILNRMGQQQEAFDLLNQAYAHMQFLALEQQDIVRAVEPNLIQHSETIFRHIAAFCAAQRNSEWQLELDALQKAHHHFNQLKLYSERTSAVYTLN